MLIRRCLLTFAFVAFGASAQTTSYEPQSGQEGKDVVWVPTPQVVVDRMLDLAKVGPGDFVMDLGSGDGRTVIAAAKRGARAVGIEYNPDLVEYSKRAAAKEGVSRNASFEHADLFETDLSRATVITMFLLPDINLKLRPRILALKPGTRIVSNTFSMGDWEADVTDTVPEAAGCNSSWCKVLFWVVPAQVAGTHPTRHGELTLRQHYQTLSGTLRSGTTTYALEGRVRGEEITFTAGGRNYAGRMNGKTLELR
jgi:SAM-dependent methyltransferase